MHSIELMLRRLISLARIDEADNRDGRKAITEMSGRVKNIHCLLSEEVIVMHQKVLKTLNFVFLASFCTFS